jgi:carboxymethylenebutenolidase
LLQHEEKIQMTSTQPEGYLALPNMVTGSPVLVLHAWWGLNETIKAFCRRMADSGFIAFAPDLYHGKVVDTIPDAEGMSSSLNGQKAREDIINAMQFLLAHAGQPQGSLAVIGFSLGAYFALDLSTAESDHVHSVVVFYGTGPSDFSQSRAVYLGHFAENDQFEPPENVAGLENALRSAGRPAIIHRYPGTGHWFFEPDRMEAYNQAAANLAWERTLSFLKNPTGF